MGWRGFGFVHRSRTISCRAVPNPNIATCFIVGNDSFAALSPRCRCRCAAFNRAFNSIGMSSKFNRDFNRAFKFNWDFHLPGAPRAALLTPSGGWGPQAAYRVVNGSDVVARVPRSMNALWAQVCVGGPSKCS